MRDQREMFGPFTSTTTADLGLSLALGIAGAAPAAAAKAAPLIATAAQRIAGGGQESYSFMRPQAPRGVYDGAFISG